MVDPSGHYDRQVGGDGYGRIFDVGRYLRHRYGGSVNYKSAKILKMSPKTMTEVSGNKPAGDVCVKVAIARILAYYSQTHPWIDSDISNIYKVAMKLGGGGEYTNLGPTAWIAEETMATS